MFCDCRICRYAAQNRGKDIKTRSQAIVDDTLLIDFPADTYMHMLYNGLDLKSIRHCIVTHSHDDHLYERDLWCRNPGIANDIPDEPMHFYAGASGYDQIQRFVDGTVSADRVVAHAIRPFEPFAVLDYRVIPLKADHDPNSTPVFFLIEKGDKTLLYAHDTGEFPQETWEYLKGYGRRFDLVSLDCTGMLLVDYRRGHMGLSVDYEVAQRLREMALLDDSTRVVVNHFSHNGNATHEELVQAAAVYGFTVSYDGLEITF